jgi:hypothetical protein
MEVRKSFLKMFAIGVVQVALAIGCAAQEAPELQAATAQRSPDVVFVPTPPEVVQAMLDQAQVTAKDVVYDLGSGDGRMVITAAQKYGSRGVGIDIDPQRISDSRKNAAKAGVTDRVKFTQGDLFEADIREATVVTLYLLSELNRRLRPRLLSELRPGTRVVSHDFDMGEWEPDVTKAVKSSVRTHNVHFWVIPANVAGQWQWTSAASDPQEHKLVLEQEFQKLTGKLTAAGKEVAIANGRVRGTRISFEVPGENGGAPTKYTGRVNGTEIQGTIATRGDAKTLAWKARRSAAAAGR